MSEETRVSKNRFHGLWALTNRDLKKWYQNPIVFIIGIIQPILWLALLGKAMNIGAIIPTGIPGINTSAIMQKTFGTSDYFSFMAMGMVAFTTVFTTAFVGISVVFDRRLGFMNKVLSTPVSRSVIIISKVISASIRSVFQAAIVTVIAYPTRASTGRKLHCVQRIRSLRHCIPHRLRLVINVHRHHSKDDKNGDATGNLQLGNFALDVCQQRLLPNRKHAQLAPSNSQR